MTTDAAGAPVAPALPGRARSALPASLPFLAFLALYALTLSENLTVAHDSAPYLKRIVAGDPALHPHHLLYEPASALWLGALARRAGAPRAGGRPGGGRRAAQRRVRRAGRAAHVPAAAPAGGAELRRGPARRGPARPVGRTVVLKHRGRGLRHPARAAALVPLPAERAGGGGPARLGRGRGRARAGRAVPSGPRPVRRGGGRAPRAGRPAAGRGGVAAARGPRRRRVADRGAGLRRLARRRGALAHRLRPQGRLLAPARRARDAADGGGGLRPLGGRRALPVRPARGPGGAGRRLPGQGARRRGVPGARPRPGRHPCAAARLGGARAAGDGRADVAPARAPRVLAPPAGAPGPDARVVRRLRGVLHALGALQEPYNSEFWLAQNVCFWLVFACLLHEGRPEQRAGGRPWAPRALALGLAAALLFAVNWFRSIRFTTDRANDATYRQIAALVGGATTPDDLVVAGEWWILGDYLDLFVTAPHVAMTRLYERHGDGALARAEEMVAATLARGGRVFVLDGVVEEGAAAAGGHYLGEGYRRVLRRFVERTLTTPRGGGTVGRTGEAHVLEP